MKIRKFAMSACALAMLLMAPLSAGAEEVTPQILINGNGLLAETMKRGKIVLTYDVRPVRAQGLELYIDELPLDPQGKNETEKVRFDKPYGEVPIEFGDREAGIYIFSARAIDAEGHPVAAPSRAVHMRYGGERAMKNFEKRRMSMYGMNKQHSDVFKDVVLYDNIPDVSAEIVPQVSVLKPGETVRLSYKIGMDLKPSDEDMEKILHDVDTSIHWRLKGEGKLRILSSTEALYESPEEGEHAVKVFVRFLNQEDEATIYVTKMKIGQELK